MLSSFGDGDDTTVAAGIERALDRLDRKVDVVNLSLGTFTANDELPRPPGTRGRVDRSSRLRYLK